MALYDGGRKYIYHHIGASLIVIVTVQENNNSEYILSKITMWENTSNRIW